MDENLIELPFNGRTIECKPLITSQFTALEMARSSKDTSHRAHIMFRVLESRVGPEQWADLELDMAMGVEMPEFLTLIEQLLNRSRALIEGTTEDDPKVDAVVQAAIAEAEARLAKLRKGNA